MTQDRALDILKSGANVFLTGEPGSGKTHTINAYVSYLRSCSIEPAITASTGIAATHIGGMTIHSWSGIGITKSISSYDLDRLSQTERLVSRIGRTRVLILDEISMLDAETFSSVERVCRTLRHSEEPFGGLQVIVVGDFFQLPPISRAGEPPARFAFESAAWDRASFITAYLAEQHRQEDETFLALLGALRAGRAGERVEKVLGSRKVATHNEREVPTKLFSHNVDVDRINIERLQELPGTTQQYVMSARGSRALVEQLKRGCLSPETLELKVGAQVMCTKNNSEAGYVNGTLATVIGFDKDSGDPTIELRNKRHITVAPTEWSIMDGDKVVATIVQTPLRLAWAITIHKSQGMTLDEAVMDLSKAFEYGQGYVALSRVRALGGVHLLGWNRRALEVHPKILDRDLYFRDHSKEGARTFSEMPKTDLDEMHRNFIRGSGGTWPPSQAVAEKRAVSVAAGKAPKIPTLDQTLTLLKSGEHHSLDLLAKARGLKKGTILDHLEKLKNAGKLEISDIAPLFVKDKKVRVMTEETHPAFESLGTDKLSPVFAAFGGKYSFDDLKVARLLFED